MSQFVLRQLDTASAFKAMRLIACQKYILDFELPGPGYEDGTRLLGVLWS